TAPVAVNDTYVIAPGQEFDAFQVPGDPLGIPGVLANDTDADNDPLRAFAVSQPQHGHVNIHPNGEVSYIPDPGYAGPHSFTYAANDGFVSSIATVTLIIDTPPVTTVPGTQLVQQGQLVSINGISVADSDAVSGNETITVTLTYSLGQLGAFLTDGSFIAGNP